MKVPFNDLKRHHEPFKDKFHEILSNAIENSSFVRGSQITKFENDFSDLVKAKYCIGVANGTDALELSLKSLNLTKEDEVIVPSYTWISTAESVSNIGANIRFCDTNRDTFNICPESLEASITPRTKALIVVHLAGQPADMKKISTFCNKHNIFLIEDCAQAHLAEYNGQLIGSFGDLATYSFYPGKNLGALGDAGCVTTNSEEYADKVRLLANHGCKVKGIHLIEGRNSRLDNIQACFLSAKLPFLNTFNSKRREIANIYNMKIKNKYIEKPVVPSFANPVWHLYIIRSDYRDLLKDYLNQKGISTVINYIRSLPENEAFQYLSSSVDSYRNSMHNCKKVLSIPLFPEMLDEEIDYVVDSINKFNP